MFTFFYIRSNDCIIEFIIKQKNLRRKSGQCWAIDTNHEHFWLNFKLGYVQNEKKDRYKVFYEHIGKTFFFFISLISIETDFFIQNCHF